VHTQNYVVISWILCQSLRS